jgi:hypothetical protein
MRVLSDLVLVRRPVHVESLITVKCAPTYGKVSSVRIHPRTSAYIEVRARIGYGSLSL